jgi:hypothetical protein
MKGTIYLWVLAAVWAGALVGVVGFVVEGVFSVQSSLMEPVIIVCGPLIWHRRLAFIYPLLNRGVTAAVGGGGDNARISWPKHP